MFEWLDVSAARQSNWMFKERVKQIFKWLGGSSVELDASRTSIRHNQ